MADHEIGKPKQLCDSVVLIIGGTSGAAAGVRSDERTREKEKLLGVLVADRMAVAEESYANWENGRTTPGTLIYRRIIAFLGYYPHRKPRTLGDRLRKIRRCHGLTSRQAAQLADVNDSMDFGEPRLPSKSPSPSLSMRSMTMRSSGSLNSNKAVPALPPGTNVIRARFKDYAQRIRVASQSALACSAQQTS